MTGNQQFIIAILVALVGPIISYLNAQSIKESQAVHANENAAQNALLAAQTDQLKTEINGRMSLLLETTKSDAHQSGMAEERDNQNRH